MRLLEAPVHGLLLNAYEIDDQVGAMYDMPDAVVVACIEVLDLDYLQQEGSQIHTVWQVKQKHAEAGGSQHVQKHVGASAVPHLSQISQGTEMLCIQVIASVWDHTLASCFSEGVNEIPSQKPIAAKYGGCDAADLHGGLRLRRLDVLHSAGWRSMHAYR